MIGKGIDSLLGEPRCDVFRSFTSSHINDTRSFILLFHDEIKQLFFVPAFGLHTITDVGTVKTTDEHF